MGLETLVECVVVGFAPGVFWLWFFARKDDNEPEPPLQLAVVFLLGAAAAVAAYWLRPYLNELLPRGEATWGHVLDAYGLTAISEESLKLIAFVLGGYLSRHFDEPLDGIVYGIAAALGFASVENALCFLVSDDISIIVGRAFTATLGHVAFTGFLGWMWGRARFRTGWRKVRAMVSGFAMAVLFHGCYDALLLGPEPTRIYALVVALPLFLAILALAFRRARARSRKFHSRPDHPS